MLGAKEVPPPEAWFKELVYLGYESLGDAGQEGPSQAPQREPSRKRTAVFEESLHAPGPASREGGTRSSGLDGFLALSRQPGLPCTRSAPADVEEL